MIKKILMIFVETTQNFMFGVLSSFSFSDTEMPFTAKEKVFKH